ncbi:hypothetical protein L9F63_022224, partial [Diploptera punctata]
YHIIVWMVEKKIICMLLANQAYIILCDYVVVMYRFPVKMSLQCSCYTDQRIYKPTPKSISATVRHILNRTTQYKTTASSMLKIGMFDVSIMEKRTSILKGTELHHIRLKIIFNVYTTEVKAFY